MSKEKKDQKAKAPTADIPAEAADKIVQLNQDQGEQKPKPLDAEEQKSLARFEEVLSSNLRKFWAIGSALKGIKDGELFRIGYKDFRDYCRMRWGMSYEYALRYINAAECMDKLKELGVTEDNLPSNESQVRVLVERLEADRWGKAWNRVLKTAGADRVTAEIVDEVVTKISGKTETTEASKPTPNAKPQPDKLKQIASIVTKVLNSKSDLTVDKLKKALEQIQGLIAGKKAA